MGCMMTDSDRAVLRKCLGDVEVWRSDCAAPDEIEVCVRIDGLAHGASWRCHEGVPADGPERTAILVHLAETILANAARLRAAA